MNYKIIINHFFFFFFAGYTQNGLDNKFFEGIEVSGNPDSSSGRHKLDERAVISTDILLLANFYFNAITSSSCFNLYLDLLCFLNISENPFLYYYNWHMDWATSLY